MRMMTQPTLQPQIADLPAMEQLAVLCLRGLGRREADLAGRLTARFGPAIAHSILARCDDLLQFMAIRAERPINRLDPSAPDLGVDEAAFAALCGHASRGDREAVLIDAIQLCRADLAPCLAPLAEAFALTLRRAFLSRAPIVRGCPHSTTHHPQRTS